MKSNKKTKKAPKYISVAKYAKREKISVQGVYKRIKAGLTTTKEFGPILIIE